MTFSEALKKQCLPIWEKNHQHPFVQELGKGTLDPAKFRFYMVQDYLYLIEYAKVFAIGAVKANDLDTMGKFAALLHGTLHEEMELHRQYAARFGITREELEGAEPSPVTLAYTHYMLHAAQNGTIADVAAAVLPCAWSYWEIGKSLSQIDGAADHDLYGDWVKMYSSEEFGQLAAWCIELLDHHAEGRSDAEKQRLKDIFLNTTRFEYLFWDMAYNESMWPHDE